MPTRPIVFDLDGTLVDSAPDIARALNAAMAQAELEPFETRHVVEFIGGGAPMALKRAVEARAVKLDAVAFDAMLARFYATYEQVSAEGNGLFNGAAELLGGLQDSGHQLAICTNKAEPITHVALRALGIAHHFGAIVGARDDLPKKPAADMVWRAIDLLGGERGRAVMVGDSTADLGAARAAGIPIVLISHGYSHTPVRELGADAVVDHLAELPAVLAKL